MPVQLVVSNHRPYEDAPHEACFVFRVWSGTRLLVHNSRQSRPRSCTLYQVPSKYILALPVLANQRGAKPLPRFDTDSELGTTLGGRKHALDERYCGLTHARLLGRDKRVACFGQPMCLSTESHVSDMREMNDRQSPESSLEAQLFPQFTRTFTNLQLREIGLHEGDVCKRDCVVILAVKQKSCRLLHNTNVTAQPPGGSLSHSLACPTLETSSCTA